MANINKYWVLLESLQFPVVGASNSEQDCNQRIKLNIVEFQQIIKITPKDLTSKLVTELKLCQLESKTNEIVATLDVSFEYSLYALYMMKEICENVNFHSNAREDLVSEKHKSLLLACIQDVCHFSVEQNLYKEFYANKTALFKKNANTEGNLYRLELMLELFANFVYIKPLHIGKSLEDVLLCYMAGIFSLQMACDCKVITLNDNSVSGLQSKLQKIWLELSKTVYFRNLMLLYTVVSEKQRIHRDMLLRLWSQGGFLALAKSMSESKRRDEQPIEQMIANIVAQPTYSLKAQHSLIKQIILFLKTALVTKELMPLMGCGLLSLRRLYDNREENQEFIRNWLKEQLYPFISRDNCETLEVMEWPQFVSLISLFYHMFCTSSIECLPSNILINYFPLFMQIYYELQQATDKQERTCNHLMSLILRVLNNQHSMELKSSIENLALDRQRKDADFLFKVNPLNCQEMQILRQHNANVDDKSVEDILLCTYEPITTLISILKQSSFNLLTYQIFTILFQLMPKLVIGQANEPSSETNSSDLLQSQEDIYNKMINDFQTKYQGKLQIIKALESLVQHQPLKPLINENIKDLLKILQSILDKYVSNCDNLTEIDTSILMITLVLIREILEACSEKREDYQSCLIKPLKQLQNNIEQDQLKYQIISLIKLLDGDSDISFPSSTEITQFEEARNLIEKHESYLQVEGIERMIKLIKSNDQHTISNQHVVIALALNTLKSSESYTFLNCVRLFASLVSIMESEVLDTLSDEYINESAAMDYRLVIGEAIIKVCRELGPFCYKYKNILLNCFMFGCRSTNDEFRFSSFSNLAQMCKILVHQVHNYFQELLNLIDCELTTGKYLPAKRAAVMVLSDLLEGIDNLFDYQEMLLPIYRLLKYLAHSENSDEKIRVHALNGLKCLAEKCKELFKSLGNIPLEKEIQIMGIKDKPKRKLSQHILEMN